MTQLSSQLTDLITDHRVTGHWSALTVSHPRGLRGWPLQQSALAVILLTADAAQMIDVDVFLWRQFTIWLTDTSDRFAACTCICNPRTSVNSRISSRIWITEIWSPDRLSLCPSEAGETAATNEPVEPINWQLSQHNAAAARWEVGQWAGSLWTAHHEVGGARSWVGGAQIRSYSRLRSLLRNRISYLFRCSPVSGIVKVAVICAHIYRLAIWFGSYRWVQWAKNNINLRFFMQKIRRHFIEIPQHRWSVFFARIWVDFKSFYFRFSAVIKSHRQTILSLSPAAYRLQRLWNKVCRDIHCTGQYKTEQGQKGKVPLYSAADRAAIHPRRQQAKPAHTDFDLCCHTPRT